MPVSFPTTSTVAKRVEQNAYKTVELAELVKAASRGEGEGRGKGKQAEAGGSKDISEPSGTHVHTLTIEVELGAPPPQITYRHREPEANPAYAQLDALRSSLKAVTKACEPLTIIRPADQVLGIDLPPSKGAFAPKSTLSVAVYPSSSEERTTRGTERPLVRLEEKTRWRDYSLDIPGAKEWNKQSTAWDSTSWLHAVLALDSRERAMRNQVYRDDVRRFELRTGLQMAWEPAEGKKAAEKKAQRKKGAEEGSDGEDEDYEDNGVDAESEIGDEEKEGEKIKLIITVNVYLNFAALATPAPEIGTDLIGLILHSLVPSDLPLMVDASDKRYDALRSFFACMQPAPFLPRGMNASDLQPKAMRSTLLPFQLRTLRLLLEREHAAGYENSALSETADPRGFWAQLDVGGQNVAYRRATGEMLSLPESAASASANRKGKGRAMDADVDMESEGALGGLSAADRKLLPPLVDLSKVRGTMLCEEMGLGKTVEAIALMLHHRHPLSTSRSSLEMAPEAPASSSEEAEEFDIDMLDDYAPPTAARERKRVAAAHVNVPNMDLLAGPPGLEDEEISGWLQAELDAFSGTKVWSEESQLDVTEVATTLIVTPSVLLKQWVSEIQTHAPGLRVCVYEGWKKLQDGIRRQQASQNKSNGAKPGDKKRKATEALRKKVVKKYSGGKGQVNGEEEAEGAEYVEEPVKEEASSADPLSLLEVTQVEFEKYVRAHDIVICTYQDLASDLKVAHPAPSRSRRKNIDYKENERPRSPLIMVEWWRVCMDEVQLSSDQSAASEMVALIPRRNSLAVSGTPAKTDIKDLLGVLRFLRVPRIPYDGRLWYRLQQPSFRPAFEGLFRAISVRTTKRQVQDELTIPRQTRYAVPIELSQIEQHYYLDTLGRQREIMTRRGGGGLDRAALKACLLNLRQICTHMQVGLLQAGAGGPRERLNLGKELMTMKEALEKMKSDHVAEFLSESRLQLRLMVRLGQLILSDKDDDLRLLQAAAKFERCRETIAKQLGPVRGELQRLLAANGDIEIDDDALSTGTAEKKGLSQQEKEKAGAITSARTTIRELLLILHQASFLMGDVRHQQGEEDLETEEYAKADVIRKEILGGSLRQSIVAIARLDRQVEASDFKDVEMLQTEDDCGRGGISSADAIESSNELLRLINENALIIWDWRQKIIELLRAPVEAEQAEDAVPGGDAPAEANAEEDFYGKSLKSQGQLQCYMTAYAAALVDRREMISEERNLFVEGDASRPAERTTARARQAKEAGLELGLYDEDDENKKLLDELMQERQAFMDARKGTCERPLKGYLIDLNGVVHNTTMRREEVQIAKQAADFIRGYHKEQATHLDNLNKELDLFRATFNYRVKFFAALQEISDSVAEPDAAPEGKKKRDVHDEIRSVDAEITAKEVRLAQLTTRGRYLDFLGGGQAEKDDDELREDCIICMGSSDDTHGLLLECGHFFCASCYKAYRSSQSRGCPSCRRDIDDKAITRFKLGGAPSKTNQKEMRALASADAAAITALDASAPAAGPSGEAAAAAAGTSADALLAAQLAEEDREGQNLREMEEQEFGATRAEEVEKQARERDMARVNMLDLETRREIAHMDMMGEYGSKIDFLVKHLLHYRARQPEARHVIFSNWSDSLNIVTRALRQNGIKFASFDGNKTKDVVDNFIKDKSITVFLLHAERESAGLTLTTCQVVHLLEPVLRHSFELQAIGRVDRLGQKNETKVYCYATRDTVESRILALGVRNGTSIYLKNDDADRGEMERRADNVVSAAGKGGDLGAGDGTGNEEELLSLLL